MDSKKVKSNKMKFETCQDCIMCRIPLFAFAKADIYTLPRHLREASDHLLYTEDGKGSQKSVGE